MSRHSPEATAQHYASNRRARNIALVAVSLGSAQSAMTLSSIQIAVPDIAQALDASAVLISWIPMSFLLVNAVFILPMGRYADRIGRKRVYLTGMLLFGVGNLLASFATSMEWLLLCRGLQGFATAMLHATGMAIIASVFSDEERPMALGLAASAIYFGLSLGPVLGGFLTEYTGWQSVFAVQVPVCLLNAALVIRFLPGEWRSVEAFPVDWKGVFWLFLALLGLVLALSIPPTVGNWPQQTGLLLVALLAAVSLWRHLHRCEYPLVRIRAIRGNSVFLSSLGSAFFVYSGNYTLVFLLSLFLQYLLGLAPSQAGMVVLLQTITIAVVSLLVGRLGKGRGDRQLVAIGCALVAVGFLILSTISPASPLWLIVLALVLNGVGMGIFTTPNNNAAFGSINPDRLSAASAILNLARYLGNMLGTAVVLLLMALLLGNREIAAQGDTALQQVVQVAFGFAVLAASAASIIAYRTRTD